MHAPHWLAHGALQCSHAAVRADNAVPLVPPQVNTFRHLTSFPEVCPVSAVDTGSLSGC